MKMCNCGTPAAVRRNGDYVCARCAELEKMETYRHKSAGVKESSTASSQLDWDTYWTENLNWGSALVKLERKHA